MNSKTRNQIQEIKRKIKNPITGTGEFTSDNAVIEMAINRFYESLKKQRVL